VFFGNGERGQPVWQNRTEVVQSAVFPREKKEVVYIIQEGWGGNLGGSGETDLSNRGGEGGSFGLEGGRRRKRVKGFAI